jgi:hypothetical protein
MRFWKILALVSLILVFARPVQAQDNPVIEKLEVDLWPEYDRPGVLVIYRITLSPDTSLPAQMSIRMPREVKKPFNLAMQNADGLFNLNYDTAIAGDWVTISFTTPSPNLQIEYYDPRLEKNNDAHQYEFRWPGDFTVKSFSLQVQKPLNATDIQITPDMGVGEMGKDGLFYYSQVVGEVPSGTTLQVSLSYTKADDSLSVNMQPVQSAQPVTEQTTGRVSFIEMLPWMVGALGLLLIGGGALWYWQSGREEATQQKIQRHSNSERRKNQAAEPSGNIYCHQCGKRAAPGDVFCRVCGTKLRIE